MPASGRAFTGRRRVRWGDGDRRGRLRLDAVARYLQDVANDNVRDAGHDPGAAWVVRRTSIDVVEPPTVGELLELTTWASGTGRSWAERRTSITGDAGGRVEAVALWIFLDPASGRPTRLTPEFHDTWGEAAGGRKVAARHLLGPPPDGLAGRPWPLRSTDLDGLDHVNNAATWAPVEDELDRLDLTARRADLEYGDGIDRSDDVTLSSTADDTGLVRIWLTVAGTVRAAAAVRVA
jgi:acyl-ACP thioesterase